MDGVGNAILRADAWLWHLSNVTVGVAVFLATVLFARPGAYSVNLIIASVDPFYIVAPSLYCTPAGVGLICGGGTRTTRYCDSVGLQSNLE